jgi:hypothetical protein
MDYLSFDSELLFDALIIQVTALRFVRIVISRSHRVAASITIVGANRFAPSDFAFSGILHGLNHRA